MKMNKILLFVVLFVLVSLPAAAVSPFGLTDAPYSPFMDTISLEELVLYGGMTPDDIGFQEGAPCIKPGVKPGLSGPDPVDYLVPLNELQLPQYGFQQDIAYLQAQDKRFREIINLVGNAIQDDSVQQYKVFADDPLYQNTAYGMYFTTVYDSLMFGGEAMKIMGLLHDSATNGAMWLNYGFITNSADIKMAFDDYVETNLLFNGLMGQMEEYGYLEEAVGYAADVLGSQMQQQAAAGNNIFQAHQNLDIAGDSMDRAQDYFDVGDAAGAAKNGPLEQKMDFFGLMNMAEGLYSAGESYKLKMLVLFMLLDGTFRGGMGLREKLGATPGPPCDKDPVNICPVSMLGAPGSIGPGVPPSHAEQCCEGCPPGFYIIDSNNMPCFGMGAIKPGTPGYYPTPGGAPGPSMAGGAVAALAGEDAGNTKGLFPVFDFDINSQELPDLGDYYKRAKALSDKYQKLAASIPEDYQPDPKIVVTENAKDVSTAREAFVEAADTGLQMQPAKITYDGEPVIIAEEEGRVVIKDINENPVAAINTNVPEAVAVELKNSPENFAAELTVEGLEVASETITFNGEPVEINTQTGEIVNKDGSVIKNLGVEFAHDIEMYNLAEERLNNLNNVLAVEYNKQPIYEKDRQTYLEQKREELTLQLDAIDRQYKFEITNIRADTDLSFEQRNEKLVDLYDRVNKDLRKAIESSIADEGVRRFTYLIPEQEEALLELIDQRSKTDDYAEITDINSRILEIVYPAAGIDGYYAQLRAQNMPLEGI